MELISIVLTLIVLFVGIIIVAVKNKHEPLERNMKDFKIYNPMTKPIDVWNITSGNRYMVVPGKSKTIPDANDGDQLVFTINGKEILSRYTVDEKIQDVVVAGSVNTRNITYGESHVALKDMVSINIHNLTLMDLTFNDHIVVPSHKTVKYEGPEMNGIVTGFVLTENSGLFKPIMFHDVVTDVYVGAVTHLPTHMGDY